MRKIYLTTIKILGVVALSMLVVAGILYLGGNHANAGIAMGIGLSISGVVLMMYSFRW